MAQGTVARPDRDWRQASLIWDHRRMNNFSPDRVG